MRAARGIPRAACAPRATLRARPPAPPVSRPPKPRNAMPHWPPPGGERSGRPARAVGAGAARGYGAPHPTRVPAARVPRRLANVGHRPLNERSRLLAGPPMASARAGRAPAERARAARARRARAPRPARAATAAGQGAPPLGASSEAPARPSMASGACRACAQRVPGVRAARAGRARGTRPAHAPPTPSPFPQRHARHPRPHLGGGPGGRPRVCQAQGPPRKARAAGRRRPGPRRQVGGLRPLFRAGGVRAHVARRRRRQRHGRHPARARRDQGLHRHRRPPRRQPVEIQRVRVGRPDRQTAGQVWGQEELDHGRR